MWDYIGHLCHKLFICFPYRDPVELETSSINVHYSFNYDLLISLHSDCRIQAWKNENKESQKYKTNIHWGGGDFLWENSFLKN
jgi:hypothetical protein